MKKGRFGRNILTMLSGNILAQILVFLATPIITRIYTPSDFGEMTLIWSCIAVLSVVACLRLEQAIVIESDQVYAINIFVLCLLITFAITLVLTIGIVFFANYISELIHVQHSRRSLYFIPIGVLVFGFYSTLTFWGTRKKRFAILSLCSVIGALISIVSKIACGWFFIPSSTWLLLGNIYTLLMPVCILAVIFLLSDLSLLRQVTLRKITRALRTHKKFPTYYTVTGLLNTLSQNLPVILLAYFYSPAIVGFYGLANTLLRKPIALVSQSLSKVFLQKISERHSLGQNFREDFVTTTKWLALIGIVPFGLLGLGGERICSFVFGESWSYAGRFVQVLAPWLFFGFINSPATQVIIVLQKLKFNFIYNVVNLIFRILVLMIFSALLFSPEIVVLFFSLVGVVLNLYYIGYAYRLTNKISIVGGM